MFASGVVLDEDDRAVDGDPAEQCPGCHEDGYGWECDVHAATTTEEEE